MAGFLARSTPSMMPAARSTPASWVALSVVNPLSSVMAGAAHGATCGTQHRQCQRGHRVQTLNPKPYKEPKLQGKGHLVGGGGRHIIVHSVVRGVVQRDVAGAPPGGLEESMALSPFIWPPGDMRLVHHQEHWAGRQAH